MHRQQFEKDKQNVDVAPRGKISADAHAPRCQYYRSNHRLGKIVAYQTDPPPIPILKVAINYCFKVESPKYFIVAKDQHLHIILNIHQAQIV